MAETNETEAVKEYPAVEVGNKRTWSGIRFKKEEPVEIELDTFRCKGCGLCEFHCPRKVWGIREDYSRWQGQIAFVTDPNQCTKCMLCEIHCPDFAIQIR